MIYPRQVPVNNTYAPFSVGLSPLLPQPLNLGHVVTLPPSERVVLVNGGYTVVVTLPTLLLWNSEEDDIVMSVYYLLSFFDLLQLALI